MLAWKATHSGNRPSVGKPKLPAGPKGVPEDAVRERRERRRHACMEGELCGGDHRMENRSFRQDRGMPEDAVREKSGGVMFAPLKG